MVTKLKAIMGVLVCTVILSFGQLFFKFGAEALEFEIMKIIMNYYLWLGFVFYGIGAFILVMSLKHGEVSVLYPIIAMSYVWVSLLAMRFLGEVMTATKWSGIVGIIIGVTFIGIGGTR
ncbi:hypothetical protein KY330_01595 [Candidatus Woesearchaeota archaeon]|nr:hypothetical protein [Candidatus Woesearchaeota archaeon]